MQVSAGTKGRLLMAASLVLAVAGGAALLGTQSQIGQGFEKALKVPRGELSFAPTSHPVDTRPGDEGYWLTRAEVQSPMALAKPMVIGDRITITGTDGRERKLEVTDVKAIGTAGKASPVSLLLITCRVTEGGSQESTHVRFIVEGESPKITGTPVAKSL
jgi:hypothetical protein